jgi:hypothetical protein
VRRSAAPPSAASADCPSTALWRTKRGGRASQRRARLPSLILTLCSRSSEYHKRRQVCVKEEEQSIKETSRTLHRITGWLCDADGKRPSQRPQGIAFAFETGEGNPAPTTRSLAGARSPRLGRSAWSNAIALPRTLLPVASYVTPCYNMSVPRINPDGGGTSPMIRENRAMATKRRC